MLYLIELAACNIAAMQRRRLMKLGAASATALLLAGGAAMVVQPAVHEGKLGERARTVVGALGRAILEGSLPSDSVAQRRALDGLLDRVDQLVAALPPHAQVELSQLLALMATAPGRMAMAGLQQAWQEAATAEIQGALQTMRDSSLSLRQQAYHALHDIVGGAYFSDATTWAQLGYPGPIKI